MSGSLSSAQKNILTAELSKGGVLSSSNVTLMVNTISGDPFYCNEVAYLLGIGVSFQVSSGNPGAQYNSLAGTQPGVMQLFVPPTPSASDITYAIGAGSHEGGHAVDQLSGKNPYFQGQEDAVQFTSDELQSEAEATVFNAFATQGGAGVGFTVLGSKSITVLVNGSPVTVNGDSDLQQFITSGIPGISGSTASVTYSQTGVPSVSIPSALLELLQGVYAAGAAHAPIVVDGQTISVANYAQANALLGGESFLLQAVGVSPSQLTSFGNFTDSNGHLNQIWITPSATITITDLGGGNVQFSGVNLSSAGQSVTITGSATIPTLNKITVDADSANGVNPAPAPVTATETDSTAGSVPTTQQISVLTNGSIIATQYDSNGDPTLTGQDAAVPDDAANLPQRHDGGAT